jgi:hypothetical protein
MARKITLTNCGHHATSRRRFLFQTASVAGLGLLGAHAHAQVSGGSVRPKGTARACIFINLAGAPSHLDTFDSKDAPWNPADIDLRQYGNLILSRTLFPNLSRITNDLLVLRSVSSWEAAHERGQFYLQTSHPSNPAFAAETPHLGSVIARELGGGGPMPPFLAFNSTGIQGAAFLGGKAAPLMPPATRTGLSTLEHNYFGTASQTRFDDRFALLEALDAPLRRNPLDESMAEYADFYGSARSMMYNPSIANVLKFEQADEARYGNTDLGRQLIVARNAVRAKNGAVFITVRQSGWDTHQSMFDRNYAPNQYQLCNDLDLGVARLVEDLKASNDFDKTLIVMMGEFGRTPGALNARGGRDHHKFAMSVALLGGGVKGGRAIGETDAQGDRVITPGWSADRAIFMEDIACTIYSALGIDWTRSITDTPSGRKFEYVPYAIDGQYQPVNEVFG